MRRAAPCILLALITLLGATLRLHALGHQSLWYDETLTLESARAPLHRVADSVEHLENMPPTYFYLMHLWVRCFGDSDTSLRMPSALAAIAAIPAIFLLTRRLFSRTNAALLAALLLAISRFQITYAQEARAYSLVFLLAILSCHCLAILRNHPNRRPAQIGYVLAGAAMLWLHPFSVFVLAAQAIWFLAAWLTRLSFPSPGAPGVGQRGGLFPSRTEDPHPNPPPEYQEREKPLSLRQFCTLSAAQILLFGPYIPHMLAIAARGQPWMWRHRPTLWSSFLLYTDTLPLLLLCLALIAIGCALAIRHHLTRQSSFCLTILFLPVIIPLILSMGKHPIFTPRYSIGALAVLYPLLGFAIAALPRPISILTTLGLISLAAPNLASDFKHGVNMQQKEDARAIATDIANLARPGDLVWCPDFGVARVMRFYLHPQPPVTLIEDLPETEARPPKLWLIKANNIPADAEFSDYAVSLTTSHQRIMLLQLQRTDPDRSKH